MEKDMMDVSEIVSKNVDMGIKRESDSIGDFEKLEHDGVGSLIDAGIHVGITDPMTLVEAATEKLERNLLDSTLFDASPDESILKPMPITPPPSAEFGSFDAPTKPLPPVPANDNLLFTQSSNNNNFNKNTQDDDDDNDDFKDDDQDNNDQINESADEEFESEIESSPVKIPACQLPKVQPPQKSFSTIEPPIRTTNDKLIVEDEIAPSQIFSTMKLDTMACPMPTRKEQNDGDIVKKSSNKCTGGNNPCFWNILDPHAWFNPERLNPRVAGLIYWRRPEETGIVFGGILGILLSLAYFSLISVFSYAALISLTCTFGYRIYKTVMQAVQKTSDGHPFKDILDIDLTVSAEKVHQVADVGVVHVNAAVSELRRLFLIEDFIDSLKFGAGLWCLTYVGSWFNGMTLIIIGVVALFTLPKVYETNKVQIDQNLALVQAKINELTAKVKAAIPLGKKVEATKEE